jgi:hypothetical protein
VSDRVEKRRHAIELALAAAAERQQAEEQYRPIERRSTSILPGATITNPPWPPPSSGALPSPIPLVHRTVAEVPAAKPPTLETLARLTPRLSEPPQAQVSSYATLGSAALETSETSLQAPRSRWGMIAVATAVLFVGAVGAGIASNVFRPAAAPSPASSSMVVQPAQTIPRPAAQPPNAFASVPPSDSASSWPLLATVNASALPRAATATQPPVYPYPQSRRTPVGPAAPASGVKPKKPDDSDDSETETPPTPAQTAAPPPPPVVETPPPAPAPAPPAKSKAFDDGF